MVPWRFIEERKKGFFARSARGSPDFLPLLRRELLEVIKKYVNVDPSAVQVTVGKEDGHEVLELSVSLPESARA